MRRGRWNAGTIAVLGALLVATPAVLVGDATGAGDRGVFKRVAGVDIDGAQGAKGRAVVRCPKGTRAISGGWAMTDAEETELLVFRSRRAGKRGWAVAAIQATNDSLYTGLLSTVYCESNPRRARPVSATGSVAPGETGSVAATCPKGKKAVAGGFSVPAHPEFNPGGMPIESRRVSRRTWRVTVFAPNSEGASVTTYAYCERRPGKLRNRPNSRPTGGPGNYALARSGRCPKRITARAGGFALRDHAEPMFSIPVSVRDGRRWEVWARNLGSSSTRLISVAYCH